MILIRKANDRGHANHGWLDSHHSFSFADYYDPAHIHFGHLRVLNDDIVAASKGFDWHGHNNMEIVTIPLEGELFHRDSMGNETVIKNTEVQLMSAGTGVVHSEYNHSNETHVNFLQIWIVPEKVNVQPSYDQKVFQSEKRQDAWQLLISPNGEKDALYINQQVSFFRGSFSKQSDHLTIPEGYGAYAFVIDGKGSINGTPVEKRDAVLMTEEDKVIVNPQEGIVDVLVILTPLAVA